MVAIPRSRPSHRRDQWIISHRAMLPISMKITPNQNDIRTHPSADSAAPAETPAGVAGRPGRTRDQHRGATSAADRSNTTQLRRLAQGASASGSGAAAPTRSATAPAAQTSRTQPLNIRKMAWEIKNMAFYKPIPNRNDLQSDLQMLREQPQALDKNHPFFGLKYVSKNREIPRKLQELKNRPEYEQIKQEFIAAIKSSDWNQQPVLSHHYMSAKFPDDEVAPLIENLALLVRQEGGHVSDTEMETFASWLNFHEQFGGQKTSLYRTKVALDAKLEAAIERSPEAQNAVRMLVDAVTSGNWTSPLFAKQDVSIGAGQRIALKDLALYARKAYSDADFPAANFRLAYAWMDTLQHHNVANIKKEAPTLYPTIERARLDTIKPYVMHVPEIQEIAAELLSAISAGNLGAEVFKRNYVRQRLAAQMQHHQRNPDELPTLQEIITIAYRAGSFPPERYPVAMLWLKLREQYGATICAANGAPSAKETVWTHLACTKGEVSAHPLFDDQGSMTEKGHAYLTRVMQAYRHTPQFGGYRVDPDAIVQRLKNLPPNLRTVVEIDCGDGEHIKPNEDKAFWLTQFSDRDQTPLLGGMQDGGKEYGAHEKPATLFFPSRAVAREFDLQFLASKQTAGAIGLTPDQNVIEARRVLGRLSGDTRTRLHEQAIHPVLSPHPNVADNFVDPHESRAGAADASEHDAAFHIPHISMMPQTTRVAMEKTLPNFIRYVVQPKGEHQLAAAEALRTELGDLAFFARPGVKDYEEKVVAQYCEQQLGKLADLGSYHTDAHGRTIESPKQVAYTGFYLKMLAALKQRPLPEPYGAPADGHARYKPVFSNQWRHVENAIIKKVKERAVSMAYHQWQTTPEGQQLQDYVFATYPQPSLSALLEQLQAKAATAAQGS